MSIGFERSSKPASRPPSLARPHFHRDTFAPGKSDDVAEHEADLVAERVVGMSHSRQTRDGGEGAPANVDLQRLALRADFGSARSDLSGGQPLSVQERVFFEPRFGYDFGGVRVHADAAAARLASKLEARACTAGRNIVFAEGQYQPQTDRGRQLLAHELTHVIQQAQSGEARIQRKLEVKSGLTLDTKGFSTSKTGNTYTAPAVVRNSLSNEIFTAVLASPRIFKLKGATNAAVDASLEAHLLARHGIVDFASKKKYSFAAGSAFKMNPAYWIVDSTGWRLKPGVDRQKAIDDLNVSPKEYAIACFAATQLTMEGGGRSPTDHDSGVGDTDWIPGDWGYILNTKFPAAGGADGLEGENLIYAGKDRFWGHFGPGIEYKSLTQWFDQVKSWHGGAKIEGYRDRPNAGLE